MADLHPAPFRDLVTRMFLEPTKQQTIFDLPLRKVFESPTVARLSADIEQLLLARIEAMSEEEVQRSLTSTSQGPVAGGSP